MSNLIYLSDICDFQGGTQPPKEQWSTSLKDGYVRMLQIRDFTQSEKAEPEYVRYSTNLKMCKSDDILIARYGASLGKILTGLSGAYNVAIMKTIPKENKITKSYLYYFLLSDSFQNMIKSFASRAAQAGFNKQDLSLIKLKCPSIEQQEEECIILNYVYNLIDKRKQQILLLDKLIKSRFIEMFGDLVINSMSWKGAKVGDNCFVTKLAGFEYTQYINYSDTGDVVMVKAQNIKNGKLNGKELSFISKEVSDSLPRSQLAPGDVVMTYVGANIGDVAVIDDKYKYHLAPNVAKIRADLTVLNSTYLMYMLMFLNAYIVNNSADTAKAALSMERIRELKIFIPPINLQNQFADFVKLTDKSKFVIQKSLNYLL